MSPIEGTMQRVVPGGVAGGVHGEDSGVGPEGRGDEGAEEARGGGASEFALASVEQRLLLLQVRSVGARVNNATERVETAERERILSLDRQRAAQYAAQSAQEDSSFWGDVASMAKVVAIVGAVAAATATCGSSIVVTMAIAGAAAQGVGMVARKMGANEVTCDVLEYGGMAASLAAGGLGVCSAVGQATAGAGAQAAGETARWVAGAGRAVQGAAEATRGVATAKGGEAAARVLDARADVLRETGRQDAAQDEWREGVEDMRRATVAGQRALDAASRRLEERDQTRAALLARMRG